MSSQFIGTAYLILSTFAILVLAQSAQKPLCINSQIIEKFTMTDESQVYRCALKKNVSYSAKFVESQPLIEAKVLAFESWMNRVWSTKPSKINVTLSKSPVVTQISGKDILIWEQNFKSTQQLEVEVAKNYLLNLNPSFFSQNSLALNSLSDFIVRIWSENKSSSYGGFSTYVAYQWWLSYSALNMKDQFFLLQKLPQIIKAAEGKVFKDPETKSYDQLVQLTELFSQEGIFFTLLKNRNQFEENSLVAAFDYLILIPELKSKTFQDFQRIQNMRPTLNLGLWDGKNLYHVGSKSQIAAGSFSKLKVQHLIWESCDDLELKAVLNVSAEIQKLLVIKNCSVQNSPDYSQYIRKGIAGFAASNPQTSFVHLDMPSLVMRRDEISLQQKIFELMAEQAIKKEGKNSFLGLFGIEQLNWNRELQIYIPKAQIDAVESFRVIQTN